MFENDRRQSEACKGYDDRSTSPEIVNQNVLHLVWNPFPLRFLGN